MKLEYEDLISPFPIVLPIGRIDKPFLKNIADSSNDMSFAKFAYYEMLLKLTPQKFFEVFLENGEKLWEELDSDKKSMTIFDLLFESDFLIDRYIAMFNFFFHETVIFQEDEFVLLNGVSSDMGKLTAENVVGIIDRDSFDIVLNILQQVCKIASPKEENIDDLNFKNSTARKIYEKMMNAKKAKEDAEAKKNSRYFELPNIISAVCARHPSINWTNVYELTVYQLLDTFEQMRQNEFYDIQSTSVSVWGDEKKTFDPSLWYQNKYDD